MKPRLAVAAMLLLTACDIASLPEHDAPDISIPLLISVSEGEAKALEGVLRVDSGCLYLHPSKGGPLLPAFTTDAEWRRDLGAVMIGELWFRPDVRVRLWGRLLPASPAEWRYPPAAGCAYERMRNREVKRFGFPKKKGPAALPGLSFFNSFDVLSRDCREG